jgi:large subunit ribosomal protein L15
MSILQTLKPITKKKAKRLGRGYGSGKGGHTSTRGMKGSGARKSSNSPIYFEGGQLPLIKRLPMIRGKSRFQSFAKVAEVNLGTLDKLPDSTISLETLKLTKLIDTRSTAAKVIATGKLTHPITVSGLRLTAGAKKAIEAAGGKIE